VVPPTSVLLFIALHGTLHLMLFHLFPYSPPPAPTLPQHAPPETPGPAYARELSVRTFAGACTKSDVLSSAAGAFYIQTKRTRHTVSDGGSPVDQTPTTPSDGGGNKARRPLKLPSAYDAGAPQVTPTTAPGGACMGEGRSRAQRGQSR